MTVGWPKNQQNQSKEKPAISYPKPMPEMATMAAMMARIGSPVKSDVLRSTKHACNASARSDEVMR